MILRQRRRLFQRHVAGGAGQAGRKARDMVDGAAVRCRLQHPRDMGKIAPQRRPAPPNGAAIKKPQPRRRHPLRQGRQDRLLEMRQAFDRLAQKAVRPCGTGRRLGPWIARHAEDHRHAQGLPREAGDQSGAVAVGQAMSTITAAGR